MVHTWRCQGMPHSHRGLVHGGPKWGKLVSQKVHAFNLPSQRYPRSSQVTQAHLHYLLVHCELSHVAPIGLSSTVESGHHKVTLWEEIGSVSSILHTRRRCDGPLFPERSRQSPVARPMSGSGAHQHRREGDLSPATHGYRSDTFVCCRTSCTYRECLRTPCRPWSALRLRCSLRFHIQGKPWSSSYQGTIAEGTFEFLSPT
jgi:hypothetical protein